jgi:hypothetical protein
MSEVSVGVADSPLEASIICSMLGVEGIPSYTRAIMPWVRRWGLRANPVSILVREQDAPRAAELIAAGQHAVSPPRPHRRRRRRTRRPGHKHVG